MFVKLMYNDNIFLRGAILLKLLEDRILKDGIVKPGNVLKVDSFLNHQMDISLFNDMGKEFKRLFNDTPINKILSTQPPVMKNVVLILYLSRMSRIFIVSSSPHAASNDMETYFLEVSRLVFLLRSTQYIGSLRLPMLQLPMIAPPPIPFP